MATLELVRCACSKTCSCEVSSDRAVIVKGLSYCSQACADGHIGASACPKATCGCNAA
jgi:metallothionein